MSYVFALVVMVGDEEEYKFKNPAFKLRQQQQGDYSDELSSCKMTALRKAMNEYWRHNKT
jgi:hypothetical protein